MLTISPYRGGDLPNQFVLWLSTLRDKLSRLFLHVGSGRVVPVGAVTMYAGGTIDDGWLLCDGSAVSRATYAKLFDTIGTTWGAGDGSTTFNLPDMSGRAPVGVDAGQTEFDALAKTGGAKTHTLTTDEMPAHGHSVSGTTGSKSVSHDHGNGSLSTDTEGDHQHTIFGTDTTAGGSNGFGIGDLSLVSGQNYSSNAAGSHNHDVTGRTGLSSATSHDHSFSATAGDTGGGSAHNNLQPYAVFNFIICAKPLR